MFKAVVLGTAHPHIFSMAQTARAASEQELVGVWDDDPQRLETNAAKIGAPAIASLDEALAAGPSVAVVAAVPGDRAAVIERALDSGAAVWVDKPLSVTRAGLERVRTAVERTGRPVIVYYPYRGYPEVAAAKAALDSGAIGRLVRIFSAGPHKLNPPTRPAWHWTRAGNGGILIDIGSHHADLCCWLAGGAPEWLSAVHGNFDQPEHKEFQDFGQVQMRFPGGALAHIEVDWLNPVSMKNFGDSRIWLQGAHGKIELRLGDETTAEIWTHQEPRRPLDVSPYPSEEEWSRGILRDLAAGRPTAIAQEDVWRASRVTMAAYDSAMSGGKPVEGKIA
jgi:predicted dehydrogenase